MKTAQILEYDKNNITLTLQDAPKPVPAVGQALLRILTAGVNPLDNMISRGEVKLISPYKFPLIAGNEVVGVIEELNASGSSLTIGERVYARLPLNSIGAFAEFVAVDTDALATVPAYLSDVEAAAVPLTALTIMQSLDLMQPKAGQTIFISGGTGGVGAMAIPLAKSQGLSVITNGSAANKDRVLALGADQFLDYKTEDYERELSNVDFALDTLGGAETEKQMRILKPGGHIVSLRAMPNGAFAKRMNLSKAKQFLFGLAGRKFDKLVAKHHVKYDFVFVESNGKQLREVSFLLEKLQLQPSIDTVFDFADMNKALDKIANGRSSGKTVLSISERK